MIAVFLWWLALGGLGLAVLPLTASLFKTLPDRGYPLTKALGLLVTGYFFWLAGSLHVLENTQWAIVLVVLLLAAGCWLPSRAWRQRGLAAFREQWRLVVAAEAFFGVAFLALLGLLAYNTNVVTVESMDFGFPNAILRSQYFPPIDPWMSGYTIRYYYFGHLLMALLTRLTGTLPSVAFTLSIATFFALTASGVGSVVYNLVVGRGGRPALAFLLGALGAVFVIVLGNLEGFLELTYAQGWGSPDFWRWLYISPQMGGLYPPNVWPTGGLPADLGWWGRASRLVPNVIDEFPLYILLLTNPHAHVSALPYDVLAVALGLAIVRAPASAPNASVSSASPGIRARLSVVRRLWPAGLSPWMPLLVGALGFLNSWDFPVYCLLIVIAYATWAYTQPKGRRQAGWRSWRWMLRVAQYAIVFGCLGVAFYLPYYLQSGVRPRGISAEPTEYTSLAHLVLFFGPFLFVALFLVLDTWWPKRNMEAISGLGAALAILVPAALPLAWRVAIVLGMGRPVDVALADPGAPLAKPAHLLFYAALAAAAWWALLRILQRPRDGTEDLASDRFVRLLIALVAVLLLIGETFFVLDNTGGRMNVVFKFYFQSWMMLAIVAAYGLYAIPRRWPRWASATALVGASALILVTLCYPLLAIPYKSQYFQTQPTLDGMDWMAGPYPGDQKAIRWLNEHVAGTPVILEAVIGGGYGYYGRVSAMTGLPTVLGWGEHEWQWRGEYPDQREIDVMDIYRSRAPATAQTLLDKYGVTYVYVGSLERWDYPPDALAKFSQFMDVVYDADGVTIYKRR